MRNRLKMGHKLGLITRGLDFELNEEYRGSKKWEFRQQSTYGNDVKS